MHQKLNNVFLFVSIAIIFAATPPAFSLTPTGVNDSANMGNIPSNSTINIDGNQQRQLTTQTTDFSKILDLTAPKKEQILHILSMADSTTTVYPATAFFGPHLLQTSTKLVAISREKPTSHDSITLLLLFALLGLGIVRYQYPVRFKETLLSGWDQRFFNQIEREGGLLNHWVPAILYLNFLIVLSLLTYQSLNLTGHSGVFNDLHPFMLVTYALIVLAGFYVVKYLLIGFIAWVFKTQEVSNAYFRNILIINSFAGLILLPIVIINLYNPIPWLLFLAWALITGINIYKILRGYHISTKRARFSMYYIILYLCTIEIVPLIFIVKYTKNLLLS